MVVFIGTALAVTSLGLAGFSAFKQIQKTKQEQQDTLQKELDIGLVKEVAKTGINPFKDDKPSFTLEKAIPLIVVAFLFVFAVFILKD